MVIETFELTNNKNIIIKGDKTYKWWTIYQGVTTLILFFMFATGHI
jgi:hypothetical protein